MPKAKDISSAELELLKILWEDAPQRSADIVRQLESSHDWHEKTIKTMLNRLSKKGVLKHQRDGRAYLYSPTIDRQAYQREVGAQVVNNVFSGRVSGLVAGFAQQGQLDSSDISELKALIESWESTGVKGGRDDD